MKLLELLDGLNPVIVLTDGSSRWELAELLVERGANDDADYRLRCRGDGNLVVMRDVDGELKPAFWQTDTTARQF